MGRSGRRQWGARMVGVLVALTGHAGLAAQPADALARAPMVNLRVELRQTEAERQSSASAGGVVSERGVTLRAGAQDHGGERGVQQQVLVLNGGRAGIRLAQARPLQWLQAVPSGAPGSGGVAWVPSTVWRDAGTGFTVRPHWAGSGAPVRVEVAAESGGLESRGFGREAHRSSNVLTTLQLPLGEWVTVAESVDEQQQGGQGAWGGGRDSGSRRLLVQMRVTAP